MSHLEQIKIPDAHWALQAVQRIATLEARNADLLAALKSALPAIDYVAEDMPGYDGVPWASVAEEVRAAIAQEEQG